jgi:hypothetical protein
MPPFHPGQRVRWLHTPRGSYGYIIPVDAEIVSVGPKRIQIQATTKAGTVAVRWVAPENLRIVEE